MIAIIVAVSSNGVIGYEGKLPWQGQLPADMDWFKGLTTEHVVIMGRRTWESIPTKFRPLPDRVNIVLSRDAIYEAPGGIVVPSLARALEMSKEQTAFVIGGSSVYQEVLPLADVIYLTKVKSIFVGDTYFPAIDETQWQLVSTENHEADGRNKFDYGFMTYERR